MHRIIAYWIVPIIIGGLLFFVLVFLFNVNSYKERKTFSSNQIEFSESETTENKVEKNSWLFTLAKPSANKDYLPVLNTYIELDLSKPILYEKIYTLNVPNLDEYQFFCLKQVLLEFRAQYQLKKENKHVSVMIESNDEVYISKIVQALKRYDIQSKITNFIRRKDAKT